ncbi:MAG: MarR family transcriptional regulator [Bacteroidota bacterium]
MKATSFDHFYFHRSLASLLGRSYSLIFKRLADYLKAQNLPISADQFRILSILWQKDGCSQQNLAILSHRNRANITRHIDSLEHLGLVKRQRDENDRRIYHIYLTEAGYALEEQAVSCAKKAITEATQGIEQQELATCLKVLRQTIANFSTGKSGTL